MWYIGQVIVALGNKILESGPEKGKVIFKKGDEFTIQGIRICSKCKGTEIDIGVYANICCNVCKEGDNNRTLWSEKNFAPKEKAAPLVSFEKIKEEYPIHAN